MQKKIKMKYLFMLAALLFSTAGFAQSKHSFTLGKEAFLLDGKPFLMISGEMHCNRIPREYWRDRLKKAKAMGLNTIGTYIFWNVHEPEPGKYDFSGNNDVAAFVKMAQEEGLWVVMRPSPYVCAEWEFGGYPYWLQKDAGLKVRSRDPKFLSYYRNYINRLSKELVPSLVTNGGNIIMIQIENEYGSYSNDVEYLDVNRKIFQEAGLNVNLFTCDPMWALRNGILPGYLPAVNGSSDPKQVKDSVNKYNNGHGPYYVAEWYPGWFDDWGKRHSRTNADGDAKKLDAVLGAGISINMYMFHGGTTRGFMNGANMNKKDPYSPQTSSYDYDAPLDEAGNPTEKFLKFREVIAKHLPAGTVLPPVPEKAPTISIRNISFSSFAPYQSARGNAIRSEKPLSFEELNQAYGFVLYKTTLTGTAKGVLKLNDLRDFATVYLNGKRIAVLDRRLKQDSVILNATDKNAVLEILVENNGRVNFGPYLTDNRKGLINGLSWNGKNLEKWEQYKFPFENTSALQFSRGASSETPGFYKGSFTLKETGDTYLDMRGFGKGFVFLNGRNLGKYWYIGPQQTIYIPAVWLNKGNNEIIVFDQLKSGHRGISAVKDPVLDEVRPSEVTSAPYGDQQMFQPAALWLDDKGEHINAHGGGVLFHNNTYYWFGEKRGRHASEGVNVYSSKDLYNWKNEGTAFSPVTDTTSEITFGCLMERPKVIYNEATRKFVMWFHLELKGKGYAAARAGVAVSDNITGPYRYLHSFRPNGNMSRDMNLYVDDDGAAYHIYSADENMDLRMVKLSADFLQPTAQDSFLFRKQREAPAIFKKDGKYFLVTSGCTGWAPNKASVHVADKVQGPYTLIGDPMVGTDAHLTFGGQSTFVLPVQGKKESYIFMADKWNPRDLKDSRYIWLPVDFKEGKPVIEWKKEWKL